MKRKIKKWIQFLLVGSFLFMSTACNYLLTLGWEWEGPYHHAVMFFGAQKTVQTSSGERYSLVGDVYGYEPCLKKHHEGTLEPIYLVCDRAGTPTVFDIEVVEDVLYCATHIGLLAYGGENLGEKLSDEWRTNSELVADGWIYSMSTHGNYIFYVVKNGKQLCTIKKYSIETKSITDVVTMEMEGDAQILETDQGKLFVDERRNISFADSYGESNRIKTHMYRDSINGIDIVDQSLSFAVNGDIVRLATDGSKILFKYQGETFEYQLPAIELHYYRQVKVQNNVVYFSVKETVEKSNCWLQNCICHHKASWVMAFDLNEKTFSICDSIGENEVVVAFSSDFVTYCARDGVYRNLNKIYDFPILIEFGKEYRRVVKGEEGPINAVTVQIADDGMKLNVYRYDASEGLLIDEYW